MAHLSRLNVSADRRHDRRARTPEEFARLLDAARTGKRIERISGPDRAMMYTLAAWTGFRKGEIGSLTYRNHAGLYADFHSCRHLFITSLERAGIRPKMAQTLARHLRLDRRVGRRPSRLLRW